MPLAVRRLGRVEYAPMAAAMQSFTAGRHADTGDELWLVEHPPVYTQGLAGRDEHLGDLRDVPLVRSNRGGQVTYHGPGQVVAYPLVDLARLGITVKEYVFRLEQAVIRTLEHYGVTGHRVAGAPGVYVRVADPFGHAPVARAGGAGVGSGAAVGRPAAAFEGLGKIAALGVKVSRHCTYHGLALNVAMDLSPFGRIDPCGYTGLAVTDLSTIGVQVPVGEVAETLAAKLVAYLDA